MKKQNATILKKAIMLLASLLVLIGCSEDETAMMTDNEPPTEEAVDNDGENGEEAENQDANLITEGLKFRNAKVIPGKIPTSVSSKNTYDQSDFKMDTDTIFWVEGVVNRIKILKPTDYPSLVGTFWAQVEGSDNYIEAEFDKEMENDTIVFLDFDFELPDGWDPPLSFNIEIVPVGDDGSPGDGIEKPVEIEEAKYNNGNCSFVDIDEGIFEWMSTWLNDSFHTGPMVWSFQEGTVGGCCDPQEGSYTMGCSPNNPDYTELPHINNYLVAFDFFKVSEPSKVSTGERIPNILGSMKEGSNNPDALNTDFCGNKAATQQSIKSNIFNAILKQNNCTFTLEQMNGQSEEVFVADGVPPIFVPLPIYMGSGPTAEYRIMSDHFIKEVRQSADSGPDGGLVRYYIRRDYSDPNNFERLRWFD